MSYFRLKDAHTYKVRSPKTQRYFIFVKENGPQKVDHPDDIDFLRGLPAFEECASAEPVGPTRAQPAPRSLKTLGAPDAGVSAPKPVTPPPAPKPVAVPQVQVQKPVTVVPPPAPKPAPAAVQAPQSKSTKASGKRSAKKG